MAALISKVRELLRQGVGRNSIFALGQSLFGLVCSFLIYRIAVSYTSLEDLGLWSLLMAFGGIAAVADVSGASALARTVARREHELSDFELAPVIHTVLASSFLINLIFAIALFLVAPWAIRAWIPVAQQAQGYALLPWVAVMLLISPFSLGLAASIDGLHKAYLRAIILIVAWFMSALIAIAAIPKLGISGMALAQVVQQATILVLSWTVLRRFVPNMGWVPSRWDRRIFYRTIAYASKSNGIAIFSLFFDPLAKFYLNRSGGTAAVAYYELASRLVVQMRNLVTSAAIPLVPALAATANARDIVFTQMLSKAHYFIALAAFAVALLSVATAPLLSFAVLNKVSTEILIFNAILTFGWTTNLFSLPLYLAAQAHGFLRWNMASHAILAVFVILLAMLPTTYFGGYAVPVGVALGLLASAVVAILGNALHLHILGTLFPFLVRLSIALIGIAGICGTALYIAVHFT